MTYTLACCGDVKQQANKTNGLYDEVNGVTYTLACCGDVRQQANKPSSLFDEVNVVNVARRQQTC